MILVVNWEWEFLVIWFFGFEFDFFDDFELIFVVVYGCGCLVGLVMIGKEIIVCEMLV